jgi:hypothetical protein
MLKFLFAGGGVAGFVLAVVLGFGYNPVSGGGGTLAHENTAAANKPSFSGKPASPTDAPVISPTVTITSQLAQASESAAPGVTNGSTPAPSAQALTDILNSLSGGTPAASSSNNTSADGGQPDFLAGLFGGGNGGSSPTDFLSLFGGGNAGGGSQTDFLSSLMGGSGSGDMTSLLTSLMGSGGNGAGFNLADLMKMFGDGQQRGRR